MLPDQIVDPLKTAKPRVSGGESPLPQRVLHILNGAAGGAAISTIDLIGEFAKHGILSSAVCHTAGDFHERRRLRDAVEGRVLFTPLYWWNRKLRVAAWKRPLVELKQLWSTGFQRGSERIACEFAASQQPDLVHTNTLTTPVGSVVANRLRVPHLWHVRELIGPGMPYRLPLEGRRLGDYLAKNAAAVIANSNTSAKCLSDWLPDGLLQVIPNGIDLSRFHLRETTATDGPLIVAMVGNLTSWKKQSLFLEAAALVDESRPIEFRLYGHVPERGKIRERLDALMERLQLQSRVRFAGFVAEPQQMMSEIDVLVHTSDFESFGRVIVEGMAGGLPVIGVRGGGIAELVVDRQTGLLAAPDSPREIATHIENLARDPALRRSLGTAGRRRAESEYGLTRCSTAILTLYRRTLSTWPSDTARDLA